MMTMKIAFLMATHLVNINEKLRQSYSTKKGTQSQFFFGVMYVYTVELKNNVADPFERLLNFCDNSTNFCYLIHAFKE